MSFVSGNIRRVDRLLAVVIAGLLIGLLVQLCACQETFNDAAAPEGPSGSASGSNIALPEGVEDIAAFSYSNNNNILYALPSGNVSIGGESNEGRVLVWKSIDGGLTWSPQSIVPSVANITTLVAGDVDEDGNVFAAVLPQEFGTTMQRDSFNVDLVYCTPDGRCSKIQGNIDLTDSVQVSFITSRYVLVNDYSTAYLINTESEEICGEIDASLLVGDIQAAAGLNEDTYLVVGYDDIACYSISDGKELECPEGLVSLFEDVRAREHQSVKLCIVDDYLFCASSDAVYRYSISTDTFEKSLRFDDLALGGGAPLFTAFAVNESDDQYYLAFFAPALAEMRYVAYSSKTDDISGKSVTVYALEQNDLLTSAILDYQKLHPETKWSIEFGVDGENAKTPEDAIRQLNARLLSGDGPDILLLDGLPVASYVDQGVLLDLAQPISEKCGSEDMYFKNILSTYTKEEKTYAVPVSFCFYSCQGDEEFVEGSTTVESLARQIAEELQEGSFRDYENNYGNFNKFRQTIKVLYDLYSIDMIQEGKIDRANLGEFYSVCELLAEATDERVDADAIDAEASSILFQSLDSIDGSRQSGIGVTAGLIDLCALLQQQNDYGSSWAPVPLGKGYYYPAIVLGVADGSSARDEAVAFIKYMLDYEYQSKFVNQFPVEKNAFRDLLENSAENHEGHVEEGDNVLFEMVFEDRPSIYVRYPGLGQNVEEIVEQMETLERPANADEVLNEMIMSGLDEILQGTKEAPEVVAEVENRANLYLSE